MTRILLLGRDGQVGWELQRALSPLGTLTALGHTEADLEKPEALRAVIREVMPKLIVNAAAYTAVDKAESEPERAAAVNARAVAVLAEEAKTAGSLLIHYSTDYVFDGTKDRPYIEDDEPNPLNVYGRTKLEGEHAIQAAGCKHLIFRTSWVYAARGRNFVKTILRLAQERDELRVIADQFGAPTSAELIADTTASCVKTIMQRLERIAEVEGIYHLVASGDTSWHDYARSIVETATKLGWPLKLVSNSIYPIATSEYPQPAKRPSNSRLATTKLSRVFGIESPLWHVHLKRVLEELATVRKA